MSDYELIDHTADIGIQVTAPGLEALFARTARALFDLTCNLEAVEGRTEIPIGLEAADLEALMVAWLNELIFHHESGALLFKEFEVAIADRRRLTAVARGETLDTRRHELYRNFKAATYHRLSVEECGDSWVARVILDV